MTQAEGFSLIDLMKTQIVRSILPEGKLRFIYGNVNGRLGKIMRGNEGASSTVGQNGRLYANCISGLNNGLAVLCFDRLMFLQESDMEQRFMNAVEGGNLLNALQIGSHYAKSLHDALNAGNGSNSQQQEGEIRLQYYSFVNRLSSVIVSFAECDNSLPPEFICGCCFDALTQIDRTDLLYTSVQSICERKVNGLTITIFLRVLNAYLLSGSLTMIPHTLLTPLILSLNDNTQRFALDQALTRLSTDNLSSALLVLAENKLFLAYTALSIRERGFYSMPLGVIHACLQSDTNLDYFSQYPSIISSTEQTSRNITAGYAGLLGFFLFLLQANVFGTTLTGTSLNSLGRCANQGDCFRFLRCGALPGEPCKENDSPPIGEYAKNDATFILGLCFYALTVRVLTDGTNTTIPEDSDEDDESTRVAVENEGYRELNRVTSDQIAGCLVWMISNPQVLQESDLLLASYLLLVFMESHYSPEVTPQAQLHCFSFIREHSECLRKEKLTCILQNYPLAEALRSQVLHYLLDLGCLQECVRILEGANAVSEIIHMLVCVARGGQITQAWNECEVYLARVGK